MKYKNCWITVNRACNLSCKWCYAKETGYKKELDIPIGMAKDIVNICDELNIRHITIIGGEPTLYPHLLELISYARGKRIDTSIVSNGLLYGNEEFVRKLKSFGLYRFSISLKGENQKTYKDITGVDGFNKIIEAIKVCKKEQLYVSISMVLTEENIDSFTECIKPLRELGVNHFHFSFCYEFNTNSEYDKKYECQNPKKIINKFVSKYDCLDKITDGNFDLFQTFPLCLWDKNIISKMNERKQISTVCQLLRKTGLLFDSSGNIIPCNSMFNIKLGKLYEDFRNGEELLNHIKKDNIVKVYNKLCSVPSMDCLSCDDYKNCGGGCVCQWTNYSFNALMDMEN